MAGEGLDLDLAPLAYLQNVPVVCSTRYPLDRTLGES